MRRFLLSLCFAHLAILSGSQTVRTPLANGYTRLNSYGSSSQDAFSFSGNQAALAGNRSLSLGAYAERRFLLQDLASFQLGMALPTSSGNFGLQANYFGSAAYNESQLGLAYGRALGKLDVGVQFNYLMLKAAGYGSTSAVNFEAGAILHVTDQFRAGVHFYNPATLTIGKNNGEQLPVAYSFGMGYDASEKFFIATEIEKTEDEPVNITAGLQYSFDENLLARMGIASATSSFYFGLGFWLNGFRIDVTASLHPSLGITPGLLLVYSSHHKE